MTNASINSGISRIVALQSGKVYLIEYMLGKITDYPNFAISIQNASTNEELFLESCTFGQVNKTFTASFTGNYRIIIKVMDNTGLPVSFFLANFGIYSLDTANGNDFASLFTPDVESYADYYPFGMLVPNRNGDSSNYRYGFNGKEKDNEIKGKSNSYDFGARIFDPRVGRWLSGDPAYYEYSSFSPYNFALNSPLANNDKDGKRVYFMPGLGGRGSDEEGFMKTRFDDEQNKYIQSVENAFAGSGVYFKELKGVNGNPGSGNREFKKGVWKDVSRSADLKFL